MANIYFTDTTKRSLYLTEERYKHIMAHSEMQNKIELIKEALENPTKITKYSLDEQVRYYYRYDKERDSKAKFLRVIVKYLNGKGFIITAYYVEHIL